jgi:two-component system CheB/CheR fusion protein
VNATGTDGPDATSQTVESTAPGSAPAFAVVGIGTSAGGLEALTDLFSQLPPEPGMAFVVLQHLGPESVGTLADLLRRHTAMPVDEVPLDTPVQQDHLYVVHPGTVLRHSDGGVLLAPRKDGSHPCMPIDSLLQSLAQEKRDQAVGVILSGTGTDGTLGLEAVKAEGGVTFAQDASAGFILCGVPPHQRVGNLDPALLTRCASFRGGRRSSYNQQVPPR